MKKSIKTIIFGASLMLASQTTLAQDLSFGAKAGANYSFTTDGLVDGNGIGYHLGGFGQFNFSDKLGVRGELLYSARTIRSVEKIDVFDTKITTNSTPSFLTLPSLANYSFDKFSLMAGPQLSFLLLNKSKVETKIGDLDPVDVESDGTDGFRGFSVDLAIGGEYEVSDNIGVGLRYVRALQSLVDSDLDDSRYNVIQLSAVYKF